MSNIEELPDQNFDDIIREQTQALIKGVTKKVEKLIERGIAKDSYTEMGNYEGAIIHYIDSDGELCEDRFLYEVMDTDEYNKFVKKISEKYKPYVIAFNANLMDDSLDIYIKFKDSWLSSTFNKLISFASPKNDGYVRLVES